MATSDDILSLQEVIILLNTRLSELEYRIDNGFVFSEQTTVDGTVDGTVDNESAHALMNYPPIASLTVETQEKPKTEFHMTYFISGKQGKKGTND